MIRFIFICSHFSFYGLCFIEIHISLSVCCFMMCLFSLRIEKLPIIQPSFINLWYMKIIFTSTIGLIAILVFPYQNYSKPLLLMAIFIISHKKLIPNHFKGQNKWKFAFKVNLRILFKFHHSLFQLFFDSTFRHTSHHTTQHTLMIHGGFHWSCPFIIILAFHHYNSFRLFIIFPFIRYILFWFHVDTTESRTHQTCSYMLYYANHADVY